MIKLGTTEVDIMKGTTGIEINLGSANIYDGGGGGNTLMPMTDVTGQNLTLNLQTFTEGMNFKLMETSDTNLPYLLLIANSGTNKVLTTQPPIWFSFTGQEYDFEGNPVDSTVHTINVSIMYESLNPATHIYSPSLKIDNGEWSTWGDWKTFDCFDDMDAGKVFGVLSRANVPEYDASKHYKIYPDFNTPLTRSELDFLIGFVEMGFADNDDIYFFLKTSYFDGTHKFFAGSGLYQLTFNGIHCYSNSDNDYKVVAVNYSN